MQICNINNMKKPKPPNVIVEELRHFFAQKGVESSTKIAEMSKIGQSQVYRNLFEKPKRVTKTLKSLCKYANISIDFELESPDPSSSAILMKALSEVWDGSESQARRISRFLFALKRADM
ncbi:hypothetical protein D0C16_17130 [Cellvibrio sp. KY-GH-1]|uniref:helix-turn-helix domain-containing protein n=1 Tax=Cellvibrio sp. KY-GH-1 TaxID=2303332 RepID=UPI001248E4EE|nr:helix-turn-helix domain-containing protein [Cellvibrio sp. KY-GH-1]QEY17555.1 hypothetical protein D0C16_17130 [Cellvibrio sp. KY-GH-1]